MVGFVDGEPAWRLVVESIDGEDTRLERPAVDPPRVAEETAPAAVDLDHADDVLAAASPKVEHRVESIVGREREVVGQQHSEGLVLEQRRAHCDGVGEAGRLLLGRVPQPKTRPGALLLREVEIPTQQLLAGCDHDDRLFEPRLSRFVEHEVDRGLAAERRQLLGDGERERVKPCAASGGGDYGSAKVGHGGRRGGRSRRRARERWVDSRKRKRRRLESPRRKGSVTE